MDLDASALARSRSAAPVPPTPSPHKPVLPRSTPSIPLPVTTATPVRNLVKFEPQSVEKKPLLRPFSSFPPVSGAQHGLEKELSRRHRSLAPDREQTPEEWSRKRIKRELGRIKAEEGLLPLSDHRDDAGRQRTMSPETPAGETKPEMPLFAQDEDAEEDRDLENRAENDEEQDIEGREIDYDDEPDEPNESGGPESNSGAQGGLSGRDPEDGGSDSDESDPQRRKRARPGSLTSVKSKGSTRKRRKAREEREREKEKEREEHERELAQLENETSGFLDSLGFDPRPTLLSVKARLTNEVAAKTTHFPTAHQVLTVKEPPARYPRSPTPPPPRRQSRQPTVPKEPSVTPAPLTDDELEDYVDDQPPPEDYLEEELPEFEVVVEKPKQLGSKEEAIARWKEETNLLTSEARAFPDAFSWTSYRRDSQDLRSLDLDLTPPLPPLISLPRTFEAHQDLITRRPPPSHTVLVWAAIFDPAAPRIDSESRQARASWQLSNFDDDVAMEKLAKVATNEGITENDYKDVAKEVFEVPKSENAFDFERIKERNWLFAQQIVQVARVRQAYRRLATPEILDALVRTRQSKRQYLEGSISTLKAERNSLPKTIGNSQRILRIDRQVDLLQVELRESTERLNRLEKHLQARLDGQ